MKLASLKCPSCSAALTVNIELEQGVCNFCGCSFLLDKEIQRVEVDVPNARVIGYEFEQGRMTSQKESLAQQREAAKELARKIRALIPQLDKIDRLVKKADELHDAIQRLEERCEQDCKGHFRTKCIAIPLVMLVVAIIFLMIANLAPIARPLLIVSIVLCVVLIPYAILRVSLNNVRLSKKKGAYEKIGDEISVVFDKYDFDIVPKEIMSSEALNYIANLLSAGRANNLKDALQMYEHYCHQQETERYQRESLRLQAQQVQETAETRKGIMKGSVIAGSAVLLAGWKIAKSIAKRNG